MDQHQKKVAEVAAAVRALDGERAFIAKGGVHHVVPLPGDARFSGRAVDTSALTSILSIDAASLTCVAEPGVTFSELVRATLALGLLPKVVPELTGITLGGAVAGCSVEAMSYRYGGFHDTCLAYELVDGTGAIRELTPADELFGMVHGSYGTLGILTRLTFSLVPALPSVALEYRSFPRFADFSAALADVCASGEFDFVDGIIHSPSQCVLVLGSFSDQPASFDPLAGPFYRRTARLARDLLPTYDYCFRYDADCHWLSRTVRALEWPWVRRRVGRWFLGSTNMIRVADPFARVMRRRRPDVVVDVFIPYSNFGRFFDWYSRSLNYWPLWIVPYRPPAPYPWIATERQDAMRGELMIDCAVYGMRNTDPRVDWSALLEERTYALGGMKTLISRNHHTREQFWRMYNEPAYRSAKSSLDPHGVFADLYEKFH